MHLGSLLTIRQSNVDNQAQEPIPSSGVTGSREGLALRRGSAGQKRRARQDR